jgi:hypothetical protein
MESQSKGNCKGEKVKIAFNTFRGKNTFGSVAVYQDGDELWARITVNGLEKAYECIEGPDLFDYVEEDQP